MAILRPGHIVSMENLSSRKSSRTRALIKDAGAELRFLPPHSTDISPIENAFSQIKAHFKQAGERTITALRDRIGQVLDLVISQHAQNHFTKCGNDPT